MIPKIFIVGLPRSGSTFLRSVLGAHTDIYEVEEETTLFNLDSYFSKLVNSPNSINLNIFINNFNNAYWLRKVNFGGEWNPGLHNSIDESVVKAALSKLKSTFIEGNIDSIRIFLDDLFLCNDHKTFIEKTPIHCMNVSTIKHLYKDSIIIYTTRSHEKIINSLPNQDWFLESQDPVVYLENYIEQAQAEISKCDGVIMCDMHKFCEDPTDLIDTIVELGIPKSGRDSIYNKYSTLNCKDLINGNIVQSDKRVN